MFMLFVRATILSLFLRNVVFFELCAELVLEIILASEFYCSNCVLSKKDFVFKFTTNTGISFFLSSKFHKHF